MWQDSQSIIPSPKHRSGCQGLLLGHSLLALAVTQKPSELISTCHQQARTAGLPLSASLISNERVGRKPYVENRFVFMSHTVIIGNAEKTPACALCFIRAAGRGVSRTWCLCFRKGFLGWESVLSPRGLSDVGVVHPSSKGSVAALRRAVSYNC